ncbi:MAG: transglycosylase domain-containing protein, partial [Clostridia bacterium]|nr:transglycosylase domain-containing protein [Clostridia bacterium]
MKTIKRLLWLILIVLVIVGGVQIKGGYDKYQQALTDRPLNEVLDELQDKDNYTQYEDVPEIYYKALVAVEDRRFYKHNGFDIIGSARAIYNDIKAWELLEGGSTISQQLAKNLYFPQDNTLRRKIAEIFMAMKIER